MGLFTLRLRTTLGLAVFGGVLASMALPAASVSRTDGNPFSAASRTAIVYFVPLDAHAQQLLNAVVPTLQAWLPANQQLQIAPARKSWADSARQGELNTTKVATDLINEFRQVQGARTVAIFSVSSQFVYSPDPPNYSFVFGAWVQPRRFQYSAVFGTGPMRVYQPSREKARLTKFMLRYIGDIVCNPYLHRNSNPHSVMYDLVVSTADIDRMVPTLPAHCRQR